MHCHLAYLTYMQSVCVLVSQLCPTLCDPLDCSPQCSSVHGILQARILEWVAIPFSKGFSQPRSPALQADYICRVHHVKCQAG